MRLFKEARQWRRVVVLGALVAGLALLFPDLAHASSSSSSSTGGALPWEGGLTTFTNSLKGPVAFAFSLVGIIVCGGSLIWGGELPEFARKGLMVVLVIALLVCANSVLTALYSSAAVF